LRRTGFPRSRERGHIEAIWHRTAEPL